MWKMRIEMVWPPNNVAFQISFLGRAQTILVPNFHKNNLMEF